MFYLCSLQSRNRSLRPKLTEAKKTILNYVSEYSFNSTMYFSFALLTSAWEVLDATLFFTPSWGISLLPHTFHFWCLLTTDWAFQDHKATIISVISFREVTKHPRNYPFRCCTFEGFIFHGAPRRQQSVEQLIGAGRALIRQTDTRRPWGDGW